MLKYGYGYGEYFNPSPGLDSGSLDRSGKCDGKIYSSGIGDKNREGAGFGLDVVWYPEDYDEDNLECGYGYGDINEIKYFGEGHGSGCGFNDNAGNGGGICQWLS